MDIKAWLKEHYGIEAETVILESTKEVISDLRCPLCDAEVTINGSSRWGEHTIGINYECNDGHEIEDQYYEDGLIVSEKS